MLQNQHVMNNCNKRMKHICFQCILNTVRIFFVFHVELCVCKRRLLNHLKWKFNDVSISQFYLITSKAVVSRTLSP